MKKEIGIESCIVFQYLYLRYRLGPSSLFGVFAVPELPLSPLAILGHVMAAIYNNNVLVFSHAKKSE